MIPIAAVLLSTCIAAGASPQVYQPASAEHPVAAIEAYELPLPDRDQPLLVRITYPTDATPGSEADHAGEPYPVIVWSHGLGGSKDAYQPLVTYWAAHGYVVIQPTHDDSLTKLTAEQKRSIHSRDDLKKLTASWRDRPKQISLIIDSLDKIVKDNPPLAGRIDAGRIGVGGHSFGAHTTMMVDGLTLHSPFGNRTLALADKRPIAFVAISPQGPSPAIDASSYKTMTRPMLMITGDNDTSPFDKKNDAQWRLQAWKHLPAGDKHLLWVDGAYHGFGGISGHVRYHGSGPGNDQQVTIVKTTALAMWDAYLKDDAAAKQWLHDAGDLRDGPQQATVSRK